MGIVDGAQMDLLDNSSQVNLDLQGGGRHSALQGALQRQQELLEKSSGVLQGVIAQVAAPVPGYGRVQSLETALSSATSRIMELEG